MLEPTSGPELVELLRDRHDPGLQPGLGRPTRIDRLQDLGPAPEAERRLPGPPKPGWTGEYEWDGWVPYDELPELVDPDGGFIVTANNRIVADAYPHHITSE